MFIDYIIITLMLINILLKITERGLIMDLTKFHNEFQSFIKNNESRHAEVVALLNTVVAGQTSINNTLTTIANNQNVDLGNEGSMMSSLTGLVDQINNVSSVLNNVATQVNTIQVPSSDVQAFADGIADDLATDTVSSN